MLTIWSLRFTNSNNWVAEHKCKESEALKWIDIFKKDNPEAMFNASVRKPAKMNRELYLMFRLASLRGSQK